MTILEEITQMKNQGKGDKEIVESLKEKGVSPKEINDALDQADIKSAVSKEPQGGVQEQNVYNPQAPSQEYEQTYDPNQPQEQETPPPQNQETYQQEGYYPQEGAESYSQGIDTDTIMEISEHVFIEKIKDIQKQVEMMNEFKNLNQSKVENIDERLKRIETTIDKLQSAILEKIGEYGNNLESIKKEMSMMQDSFGKTMKSKSSASTKTNSAPTTKKKVIKK